MNLRNLLLTLGLTTCIAATTVTAQDIIFKKTPLAPTIDGVPDALWAGVDSVSLDIVYVATPPVDPANCSATVRTVWDDEYLYFLFEVSDDVYSVNSAQKWQDDSVQLYIDPDNTKATSYDTKTADLIMSRDDTEALQGRVETAFAGNVYWAIAERTGGYTAEVAVAWAGFGAGFTPENGKQFGIDLQINDDDGGNPNVVLKWHDTVGNGYINPSVFGTAELSTEEIVPEADIVFRAAATAPLIDGDIDPIWQNTESWELTNVFVATPPVDPANCSATVRALWDENYLYYLFEVTDDVYADDSTQAWQDDSVALYFDADNSKGTTYDDNDADLILRRNDSKPVEGSIESTYAGNVTWAVSETTGGYVVEIAVAWTAFGFAPEGGTMIGVDFQVNDDDGSNPNVVLKMFDQVGNGYMNASVFGTAILSIHAVTAPDGGPDSYLGYPAIDGWIDTEEWLGWLYINTAPWAWSDLIQNWIFLGEEFVSDDGGWLYVY